MFILNMKYNLLMIFLLGFSILMVFNFNTFYYMWIFMELNMMIFLTYLIINSKYVSVISMKYFLMSSFSSIIFMFFINLNFLNNYSNLYILFLNMMMLMKLGILPWHFWFIDMMINIDWVMCFVLSTIQKIIPFVMLSMIYMKNFLYLIMLMSGLIGVMLSFNHVLLKKIMAYSSMNHMFWMLMSLVLKFNLWLIYFFNYMLISGILFYFFWKFNLNQIGDMYMYMINKKSKINYYFVMLMMSLGGLPPFYGFLLKWYMIYNVIDFLNNLLLIFLIVYSLIFLYYYMRVLFNFMLFCFYSLNLNFKEVLINMINLKFIYLINLMVSFNLVMFFFWFIY